MISGILTSEEYLFLGIVDYFYKILIKRQVELEFANFNFFIVNCFIVIVALCFVAPKFSYALNNQVNEFTPSSVVQWVSL